MIRPAKTQDIPAILEVWNPEIRETLITFNAVEKTHDDLVEMLNDKAAKGYAFLVAEEQDAVLGFATYGQFRGGIGYRHTAEHTIVLAPSARGRGIGKSLMLAVEKHAATAGIHSMWAGVSAGNPEGVVFHEKVGYQKIATLPEVGRKFETWLDLILLQKHL